MNEPIFNLGDFVRVKNAEGNTQATVTSIKISQKHPNWKYRIGESKTFYDESELTLVYRKVQQPTYDGIGCCSSCHCRCS